MPSLASLAGITEEEFTRRSRAYVLDRLARGLWISYRDREYPGELIREYPDGRRFTVHVAEDGTATDVRQIPPKDRSGPPGDGRWWVTDPDAFTPKDRTCTIPADRDHT